MNGVLARIVEATRARLEAEPVDWRNLHRAARARSSRKPKFSFRSALRRGEGTRLIAEIKAASPSAGTIVEKPDVAAIAREYREGGAVAISVVTEPQFFCGDRAWLHAAAGGAALPILMKDFIIAPVQIYQGIAAGADAVLLIAAILDAGQIAEMVAVAEELGRDALVEIHDERDLEKALAGRARIIGVNNRNLDDFSVDLSVAERLALAIPRDVLRISESGIRTRENVERLQAAGYDAFLVGETLLRSVDRKAAVARLRGAA